MAGNTGKALSHFVMGVAHVLFGRQDQEGDDDGGEETEVHEIQRPARRFKRQQQSDPSCCDARRVPPVRRPRR